MSGRNYVEKRDYPRMSIKASITYRIEGDGAMYTGMSENFSIQEFSLLPKEHCY